MFDETLHVQDRTSGEQRLKHISPTLRFVIRETGEGRIVNSEAVIQGCCFVPARTSVVYVIERGRVGEMELSTFNQGYLSCCPEQD